MKISTDKKRDAFYAGFRMGVRAKDGKSLPEPGTPQWRFPHSPTLQKIYREAYRLGAEAVWSALKIWEEK